MIDALYSFLQKHIEKFERLISCERLSGGASQETYRLAVKIGGQEIKMAMRRAMQREIDGQPKQSLFGSSPGLAVEARLMQIAREHRVPAPNVCGVFSPEDDLGEGFVMEWLDGETLGKRILSSPVLDEIRPQLAFQCGEILARIHAIDTELTGLDRHLIKQTPRAALAHIDAIYQSFDTPRPMIDYTAAWLKDHLPAAPPLTLVHNDFRNGNMIVAPEGIVAVLDWELAAIADPMCDLGWLCANCWRFGRSDHPVGGFGFYEDLFSGYESVSGKEVDRARVKFWEVFGSFRWAVICLSMAQQWLSGADRSLERAAIGRRASESEIDCANLLIAGGIDAFDETREPLGLDMPESEELLIAVRDHLLAEKESSSSARAGFIALVGANALDIVLRQLRMGQAHQTLEQKALEKTLNQKGALSELRWTLIRQLREGKISLDDENLKFYLRNQTARQVMIDQPNYSGLKTARKMSAN